MKKLAANTGLLVLALIAISGVSIMLNFETILSSDNAVSKTSGGALMLSNVEVIQRDDAGNIVAYRQGANHIVDSGMEIIAAQVFGRGANPSAVPVDAGATVSNNTNSTQGWGGHVQWMEIGNGTGASIPTAGRTCGAGAVAGPSGAVLGWDNKSLECPLSLAFDCARQLAVIHRFNATEDPTPALSNNAQINMTAVATFSGGSNCAANNIGEAGIWTNKTSSIADGGPAYGLAREAGNNMFARNTFGTVNLSSSDSLELTWKFTFTDS